MFAVRTVIVGVALAAAVSAGLSAGVGDERRPGAGGEGREVLARFLGQWQTHTKIRHLSNPAREFETRGTASCESTLEGSTVEFRTRSIPPGEADLQIMLFDESTRQFRQWVFSSDGYRHEAVGTWDPATSILRWTGQAGEQTFVIDDHWVSPDRLEWKLERRDRAGQLVQTIEGTVVRQAE